MGNVVKKTSSVDFAYIELLGFEKILIILAKKLLDYFFGLGVLALSDGHPSIPDMLVNL